MSWLRGRWVPVTVLVAAVAGLVVLSVWGMRPASWRDDSAWRGPGMGMMGSMMQGRGMGPGAVGSGPVDDLDEAAAAAERFADRLGLRVSEVMEFRNGFYAVLVDGDDRGATEVLIDPATGGVRLEWGPAMMWNTEFGMMSSSWRSSAPVIDPERARQLAGDWLTRYQPGLRAGEAESFPGYYTLHTLRDGDLDGMLSVHGRTGRVWYHTWHGEFERMRGHAESG